MATPPLTFHRRREGFGTGVPLFAMMRDEKYFLPHFLRHYRALGVQSFAIYADRCDDAFMAMLEAEPDVSILQSQHAYGDSFGIRPSGLPRRLIQVLKEYVSNTLFEHRWHLVVDADEFLVLPPPFEELGSYVSHLDRAGLPCSFATMVDFYPERLSGRNFGADVDPFAGAPHFDAGPYYSFDVESGQVTTFSRGIRGRLLAMLLREDRASFERLLQRNGPYRPAKNYKFPLLRTSDTVRRAGDHNIEGTVRFASSCVLAHFKFYPGLDHKLATALAERQYFQGSIEYELIGLILRKIGAHSLLGPESRTYRDIGDLVDAQLF